MSSNSPSRPAIQTSTALKETIGLINTYILDAADVLWRMRAFSQQRTPAPAVARSYLDAIPRSVVIAVKVPNPSMAVSLVMHSAFVGFAMAFIEKVNCRYFYLHKGRYALHLHLSLAIFICTKEDICVWLGGRVVRMLDLRSAGCGFKS